MRTFREGRKDPGRFEARPPRRRSRRVLLGSLLTGALVAAAAGLFGIGPNAGTGDLTLGRLASIVTSSDQSEDGKASKGGPQQGGSPANKPGENPGARDTADGKPEARHADEKGSGDHAWSHGPDGDHDGPHDGDRDDRGGDHDGDRHRDHKAIKVPCDSNKLITALVRANAESGATLRLAAGCTYLLSAYDEHTGRYESSDGRRPWGDHGNHAERSGLPLIRKPIRIQGEGATIVRPAGAQRFRFFTVRDGGQLRLSDITLKNGREADGGSIKVEFGGIAVIERTEITQSVADSPHGGGGAIANEGRLTVIESKLTDNSAAGVAGRGGGILNGGLLTVEKSELSNNSANGYGGGLANNRASADVSQSEISRNTAAVGGGIASYSSRTKVWDSTVSHNTARSGGGIATREGELAVRHTKVSDNIGFDNGGGIATIEGSAAIDDSQIGTNTTFGNGGGVAARKADLNIRDTRIVRNAAAGPDTVGGGIALDGGKLSLSRSTVTENEAVDRPGGIFASQARSEVDDETVIIRNRPTNCEGSPVEIPNCFG